MKIKRLLEQQVEALRLENSTLRQAVAPEKQKYLPWVCIPRLDDPCHNLLQDLHGKWIKEIK